MLNHLHQSARVVVLGALLVASITYVVGNTGLPRLNKHVLRLDNKPTKYVLTFYLDMDAAKVKDLQLDMQGNLVLRNDPWGPGTLPGPIHYARSTFLALLPRDIDDDGAAYQYNEASKVLTATLPKKPEDEVRLGSQYGVHASSMSVKNEMDRYQLTARLDLGDMDLSDLEVDVQEEDLIVKGTKSVKTRNWGSTSEPFSATTSPFSQSILMLPHDIDAKKTTYGYDEETQTLAVTLPKLRKGWVLAR